MVIVVIVIVTAFPNTFVVNVVIVVTVVIVVVTAFPETFVVNVVTAFSWL